MSKKKFGSNLSSFPNIRSFIRNDKGQPIGCIISVLDKVNNTFNIDFSLHNPKEKYNKDLGVHIAFQRALMPKRRNEINLYTFPKVIPFFTKMIQRSLKYFKGSNPHPRLYPFITTEHFDPDKVR